MNNPAVRPYGRVSAEERREKALELLARHALEWEEQARAASQGAPERRSVMFQDGKYRERVRRLAA